jgi:sarcosine oxidase subunit alpha
VIRNLAGLGEVNLNAHHGYYDKSYAFADVLVIGGGPAGLAAAIEAEKPEAKSSSSRKAPPSAARSNYARFVAEPGGDASLREHLVSEVASLPNVAIYTQARAQGLFADNWVPFIRGNRMVKTRAKSVVIAAGSSRTASGVPQQRSAGRDDGLGGTAADPALRR